MSYTQHYKPLLEVGANTFIHTNSKMEEQYLSNEGVSVDPIISDTLSPQKPINNFEEYGFTADFEGEILKEIEGKYVGYCKIEGRFHLSCTWTTEGKCYYGAKDSLGEGLCNQYTLIPIVPEPAYPMFKKMKNGDVFKFIDSENMVCVLSTKIANINVRLRINTFSTDTWTDVPYNAERGLYHGQPIWCHFSTSTEVCYYNVKKSHLVSADTSSVPVDGSVKFEPIPLEALRHMLFIWEQYQAFIKD